MSYRDYGFDKRDPQAVLLDPPAIRRRARQVRENFWRETYRNAFYRRLIGTCLGIVLASILVWILTILAYTPKDFQP